MKSPGPLFSDWQLKLENGSLKIQYKELQHETAKWIHTH